LGLGRRYTPDSVCGGIPRPGETWLGTKAEGRSCLERPLPSQPLWPEHRPQSPQVCAPARDLRRAPTWRS
jgi:hypothetical protein